MKKVFIEDSEEFSKNSKTYHKILTHRKKCKKWGKGFCLGCFGGGLTQFTKNLEQEKISNLGKNDKIIQGLKDYISLMDFIIEGKKQELNPYQSAFLKKLEKQIKTKQEVTLSIKRIKRSGMSACAFCPKIETFINKRRITNQRDKNS